MAPSSLTLKPTRAVSVDADAVDAMSGAIRRLSMGHPIAEEAWDDPRFWNVEAPRPDRCQFLAVGNAINFRFWSLKDGKVLPAGGRVDGEHLRGAMYMWRRLRLAIARSELSLSAEALSQLGEATFRRALQDDEAYLPLEAGLAERVANLRDLRQPLRTGLPGAQYVPQEADSQGRLAVGN